MCLARGYSKNKILFLDQVQICFAIDANPLAPHKGSSKIHTRIQQNFRCPDGYNRFATDCMLVSTRKEPFPHGSRILGLAWVAPYFVQRRIEHLGEFNDLFGG